MPRTAWVTAAWCAVLAPLLAGSVAWAAESDVSATVLRDPSALMLQRGEKIRVTLRTDEAVEGPFAGAIRDTLFVGPQRAHSGDQPIPFSYIESVERRTGSRGHALNGALVGLVAGATLGAGILAYVAKDESDPSAWVSAGVVLGAAGGTLLGSIIGHYIRSDVWTPIYTH